MLRQVTAKVLQLNYTVSNGGAARAAFRIHQSLLEHGLDLGWNSYFQATSGQVIGPNISVTTPLARSAIWRRLHPRLTNGVSATGKRAIQRCIP